MSLLNGVMTLQEAALEWNIDDSTIRHAIKNQRFHNEEIRKSSNTWLILRSAMERVYGNHEIVKIFTAGYEGKTIDQFIATLISNHIDMIFDVREIPLSRKKGFSKTALSNILNENNINYAHFKELGSPKDIRDRLYSDHNYFAFFNSYREYLHTQEATMEIIKTAIEANKKMQFCLLCFENNPMECHRSIVAEEIYNSLDTAEIINI